MGMAAGQARLLSITSRLTDNELQAQLINNAKIRLASESSRVSENYVTALNQAQMMFTNYDKDDNTSFQELTFNALTAYNPYNNQYGLCNASGKLLVSERDAKNYQKSSTMEEFLKCYGLEQKTTFFDEGSSLQTDSAGNVLYYRLNALDRPEWPSTGLNKDALERAYGPDGQNYFNLINATDDNSYNHYKVLLDKYQDAKATYYQSAITDCQTLFYGKCNLDTWITSFTYDNRGNLKTQLGNAKSLGELTTVGKSEIDKCITNIDAACSGTSTFERKKDNAGNPTISTGFPTETIDGKTGFVFSDDGSGNKLAIVYNPSGTTVSATAANQRFTLYEIIQNDDGTNTGWRKIKQYNDDGSENGDASQHCTGSPSSTGSQNYTIHLPDSEEIKFTFDYTTSAITSDVKDTIAITEDDKPSIETLVKSILTDLKSNLVGLFNISSMTSSAATNYCTAAKNLTKAMFGYEESNTGIYGFLDDYEKLAGDRFQIKDQSGSLTFDAGFKSEFKDNIFPVLALESVFNTYGEPSVTWVDTNNQSNNGMAKYHWYENLWTRMGAGIKENYTVIQDGLASSPEWIKFALESKLVTMEQVTGDYNWVSMIYSNCSDITEQTDSVAVTIAEAEYKSQMNKIETKDKQYDLQLKNIDTEHTSLQTEYESIKSAVDKNIERVFKLYS